MNTRNASGTPAPADWSEWKKHWRTTIRHAEFEWDFAMDVIPAVIGLLPSQVTPQHPFVGTDGRQYHMDFAIVTEKVKIAIELEGFDKDNSGSGQSKNQHDKFNRRIQSLTALGWKPLTITNAQFKSDPMRYANLIRQIISEPQSEKVVITQSDNSEVLKSINKIGGLIQGISTQPVAPLITPSTERDSGIAKSTKNFGIAGLAVVIALLSIIAFALLRTSDNPTPSKTFIGPAPQKYNNCTELWKFYPKGVATSDDKIGGTGAQTNPQVYALNRKSDRDGDGVACEK